MTEYLETGNREPEKKPASFDPAGFFHSSNT
jgi:hypothetical protein